MLKVRINFSIRISFPREVNGRVKELPYLRACFYDLNEASYDLKNEVLPIDRAFRRAETVTVASSLKAD